MITVVVAAAWQFSRLDFFTPWSRTGYWMGVAGGVCMLTLFTYPMRKHWRWMQRFGAAKHWFTAHMVLGLLGPLLILLHSTFRIGSLNAGVALFSMLIVAFSGVVGRFIYVRVHRDLNGQRETLQQQRDAVGLRSAELNTRGLPSPVVSLLLAYEDEALSAHSFEVHKHVWRLFVLPWRRLVVTHACKRLLRKKLLISSQEKHWSRKDYLKRKLRAQKLVKEYLLTVQRVAQFSTYDRLFSLWHVAHVPFVWIMVICAVFHVVAVHAY